MICVTDRKNCCGCSACASVCPEGSIIMQPDTMGFLYPVVNETTCIDCGLCERICQFNYSYKTYGNFEHNIVYGCRHKDEIELSRSQSGAASWALIQSFFSKPGVVYGVAFDNVTHILHKRATSLDECEQFRTSKYVQSDIRGIMPQVRRDLIDGKRVLFIGTACQVSGLKSYIPQKLHTLLYTIDIVCHATPSPEFWKRYIEYYERKRGKKIVKASFRDKRYGWHSHVEVFQFDDGKELVGKNILQRLFYDHLIVRPSCSNCPYTNFKRVSDITISDFWGWEKNYKEWNDNKGVSLMLVNSSKGEQMQKESTSFLNFIQSDTAKCVQPQLVSPIVLGGKANEVERVFAKSGFEGVARMYEYIGFKHQVNRVKAAYKILKAKIAGKK